MTKSLVQQRFGAAAADYVSSAVHAKGASLGCVVELTEPQASWPVLDVATGAGHTALAFAPYVAEVTATDSTEEMLEETRKLAASRGFANITTAYANAEALPFSSESFDLSLRIIFADVASFAREIFRVLVPGGTLALVDNVAPDAAIVPGRTTVELREWAALFQRLKKALRP